MSFDDDEVVMGLDLALRNTGVVIREMDDDPVFADVVAPPNDLRGVGRLRYNRDGICQLVEDYGVTWVTVEGYAFASQGQVFSIGENGGAVKLALWEMGVHLLVIPPGTLKKYALGDGNAKKSLMLKGVYKRWGFDTNDDNIADAYALTEFTFDFLRDLNTKTFKAMQKKVEYIEPLY